MYQIIKYFDLLNRLNFEIVSAKSSLDYRVSKYIQICAKIKELLLFLALECVYIHLKKYPLLSLENYQWGLVKPVLSAFYKAVAATPQTGSF